MLVGEGFKVLEGDYKNDILYNKLKKKILTRGPGPLGPHLGPSLLSCLPYECRTNRSKKRVGTKEKKKRDMCVREKKKEEKKWKIKRSWAISNHISYNADIHTPIS